MREADQLRVDRALARTDLLSGMEPEARSRLARLVRIRRYAPRDVVVWIGEPPEAMFFVLSGFLKAVAGGQDGREVLFSIMGEGEVIGELAVLDGQPRSATLVVLEPTELAIIDREPLLEALKASPELMLKLVGVLATRLRTLSEHCESISTLNGTARLAKVLLSLARKHGVQTADGVVIPVRLSQQDLGNMVGVTRERVNHLLREWSDLNVLRHQAGRFVITDLDTLQSALAP